MIQRLYIDLREVASAGHSVSWNARQYCYSRMIVINNKDLIDCVLNKLPSGNEEPHYSHP